ncbi:MAG: histidine phosphatase family protein [Herminiimonas sp.]|nr:histidine phosphatase family protein [Herminiimonas sp.]
MRLFLIRHPVPLIDSGVCYGRTDVAVALTEQARLATTLAMQLPAGLPVFTSPALRCTGLADALGDRPAARDARLAEMDFGEWEKRRWNDIARTEIDAWAADPIGYRPPGGETVLEVARRVRMFQESLGEMAAIVVCHAGPIRLMQAWTPAATLEDTAREAARAPHRVGYGEVILLER